MQMAVVWMEKYFDAYGDKSPNSLETKLSILYKKEIYVRYKKELWGKCPLVSKNIFCHLWNCLYPLSVNRPWCDIPGKCETCGAIDQLRKNCNSYPILKRLQEAHLLHRGGMFNLERGEYKRRILRALLQDWNDPSVLSMIIDGMDNNKCRCPYKGRQQTFSNPLPQHFLGVKVHGVGSWFYRTVGTVKKSADLTIHAILHQIELFRRRHPKRKYPTEILIQGDGGSENSNKYVYAMLELLVTKKIAKSITFTRLPTGHTHEDIDALFGVIWNSFRGDPVESLDDYKNVVENAIKNTDSKEAKVIDLYAIPDYQTFLKDCIDSKLGNMHKQIETQHQWRFESVEISVHFPFGCKTAFKAYSSSKVLNILDLIFSYYIDIDIDVYLYYGNLIGHRDI